MENQTKPTGSRVPKDINAEYLSLKINFTNLNEQFGALTDYFTQLTEDKQSDILLELERTKQNIDTIEQYLSRAHTDKASMDVSKHRVLIIQDGDKVTLSVLKKQEEQV